MVTAFDLPPEDEMGGNANFLATPGTYHLQVTHVEEQPTNRDGSAVDGFRIEFAVLEGQEKSKTINLTFRAPKQSSRDNGKWARAKQAAYLIATGLVNESRLGQRVEIDLQQSKDRQVVATLEQSEPNEQGKRFLDLAWANIYHVDDPRAASCQKNAAALALIPATLRRDAASFAKKDAAAPAATAQQPVAAGAVSDDLGDL